MKSIENDFQGIKSEYGDKIPVHLRQKLDKYIQIFREIGKIPSPKANQKYSIKMNTVFEEELYNLRREIEGEIKVNLTDYESFLWKLEHLKHEDKPIFFSHLQFGKPKASLTLEEARKNCNIPILESKTKDLIALGAEIAMENNFCRDNFDSKFISRLFTQISQKYNIMSYHNFSHGFSVLLMFFQCMEISKKLKSIFTDFQIFVGYIAALCHDMNHPGTNSAFEIKKKSNLAAKYNNQSILENMHISYFYRMNKENPELDFIAKIKSPVEKISAKRLINQLILATDITGHGKNLMKLGKLKGKNMLQLTSSQKQTVLENIFHACDIGNPALDFQNYLNWSILLAYEFDKQANKERSLNFQMTPNFMFQDMRTHYSRQVGFIDYLALPLWKEIGHIFPQLSILTKSIAKNKKQLEEMVEKN